MTEGKLCQVQLLDDRKLELLVQVLINLISFWVQLPQILGDCVLEGVLWAIIAWFFVLLFLPRLIWIDIREAECS